MKSFISGNAHLVRLRNTADRQTDKVTNSSLDKSPCHLYLPLQLSLIRVLIGGGARKNHQTKADVLCGRGAKCAADVAQLLLLLHRCTGELSAWWEPSCLRVHQAGV